MGEKRGEGRGRTREDGGGWGKGGREGRRGMGEGGGRGGGGEGEGGGRGTGGVCRAGGGRDPNKRGRGGKTERLNRGGGGWKVWGGEEEGGESCGKVGSGREPGARRVNPKIKTVPQRSLRQKFLSLESLSAWGPRFAGKLPSAQVCFLLSISVSLEPPRKAKVSDSTHTC